jgi:hypothetical protein
MSDAKLIWYNNFFAGSDGNSSKPIRFTACLFLFYIVNNKISPI